MNRTLRFESISFHTLSISYLSQLSLIDICVSAELLVSCKSAVECLDNAYGHMLLSG